MTPYTDAIASKYCEIISWPLYKPYQTHWKLLWTLPSGFGRSPPRHTSLNVSLKINIFSLPTWLASPAKLSFKAAPCEGGNTSDSGSGSLCLWCWDAVTVSVDCPPVISPWNSCQILLNFKVESWRNCWYHYAEESTWAIRWHKQFWVIVSFDYGC